MDIRLGRDLESYRLFLRGKSLPGARVHSTAMSVPDQFAGLLGVHRASGGVPSDYLPPEWMFDYQRAITALAIRRRKFAAFLDCGLGKTPILLEFARHAHQVTGMPILIVSPLMVIEQTIAEAARFFGEDYPIRQVSSVGLQAFLDGEGGIGITNYEAIRPTLSPGRMGGLVIDESSMLKSHYGKWGTKLIELGRGLDWKLCCTGTPAPNDRIEFANHAVFLDQFPTVNSFLAKYFINRGQTGERWELKPHALAPFYRSLAAWSIFVTNPCVYGWQDNAGGAPPVHLHIHEVALTDQQQQLARSVTGSLFSTDLGGIGQRSVLGQIAKGRHRGNDIATNKTVAVVDLVGSFPGESVIVWCKYNAEQEAIAAALPEAGNIAGDTIHDKRMRIVGDFQSGRLKVMISKAKILGYGLNLQSCTRMIFSGLEDSYEGYYQAIKRANRYGSTQPLHVHIPLTDLERPMVENVLRKAALVAEDSRQQEHIFKEAGHELLGL